MAGKLRLLSVGRSADGQVEGTFELVRDGQPGKGKQITEKFAPNADTASVVTQLAIRCAREVNFEPAPSQLLIEQLFPVGQDVGIPDPPVPPSDQPE